MAAWGDSLTFGLRSTGGFTYPADLSALLHHNVANGGVPSETSTQIRTRLVASSMLGLPTIIWAGRNNFADPTTIKADIAAMVAALGHTNYIILGVTTSRAVVSEFSGGADYITITQLNADLAATYGAHFLDVRAYLVSQYNPANSTDVIDHGRDVPPSSLLDPDNLHMNNAGYQAVANLVYANRAQLGLN